MVDKALVLRKVARIEDHLSQVRGRKDKGIEAFIHDRDLQSIVLFNIVQAVQACIDIGSHVISDSGWELPASQADIFRILAEKKLITRNLAGRMVKMAGFRNRIVHEYEKIDLEIVHEVWRKGIRDIDKFCAALVKGLGM